MSTIELEQLRAALGIANEDAKKLAVRCKTEVNLREEMERRYTEILRRAEQAEASNKLLSERVAVLETERDLLADQAQQYMDVTKEYFSDTVYDENGLLAEADAALFVTLYDLRRARTALEGK